MGIDLALLSQRVGDVGCETNTNNPSRNPSDDYPSSNTTIVPPYEIDHTAIYVVLVAPPGIWALCTYRKRLLAAQLSR